MRGFTALEVSLGRSSGVTFLDPPERTGGLTHLVAPSNLVHVFRVVRIAPEHERPGVLLYSPSEAVAGEEVLNVRHLKWGQVRK